MPGLLLTTVPLFVFGLFFGRASFRSSLFCIFPRRIIVAGLLPSPVLYPALYNGQEVIAENNIFPAVLARRPKGRIANRGTTVLLPPAWHQVEVLAVQN